MVGSWLVREVPVLVVGFNFKASEQVKGLRFLFGCENLRVMLLKCFSSLFPSSSPCHTAYFRHTIVHLNVRLGASHLHVTCTSKYIAAPSVQYNEALAQAAERFLLHWTFMAMPESILLKSKQPCPPFPPPKSSLTLT